MVKKEIERIEPFNDIYFKDCFYNSYFPIVEHFNKNILSFLTNDIITYRYIKNGEDRTLDMNYFSAKTAEKIMEEESLVCDSKIISKDIIDDIIYSIKNDRPVICGVDCYYESIRNDMFLKEHWPHTLLFYGFNQEKEEFNIIEHSNVDSLFYKKVNISFSDVINSYGEFVNIYKGINLNLEINNEKECGSIFSFYSNSNELNLNKKNYLHIYFNNMIAKSEEIINSLEFIKDYSKYYNEIILNEQSIYCKLNDLISSLNTILNAKKAQRYTFNKLLGCNRQLVIQLDDIIDNWSYIRALLVKFRFTSVYKETSFLKSIDNLNKIYELERKFYLGLFENGYKELEF